MREYDDYGEYRDDHIRLYTPVLQRVTILTAVIIAVPVLMWTVTTFVRSYVARPKVPGRCIGKPRPWSGGIARTADPNSAARSSCCHAAARRCRAAAKRYPGTRSRHQKRPAYCAVRRCDRHCTGSSEREYFATDPTEADPGIRARGDGQPYGRGRG
jgi:hypothetical protein